MSEHWKPPTAERMPINVHPEAVKALRDLLWTDEMRGVGYSEFIMRAVTTQRGAVSAEERQQPCPACHESASGLCSWHRDYGEQSVSPSQREAVSAEVEDDPARTDAYLKGLAAGRSEQRARAEAAEQERDTWKELAYDLRDQLHAAEQDRDRWKRRAEDVAHRLEQERNEARQERDRLQEREQKLAKALEVTDGGRYINDWFSRIDALKQDAEKWRKHIDHQHSVDRWSDAY